MTNTTKSFAADGKPCKVCSAFRNWNPSRDGRQKSTARAAATTATALGSAQLSSRAHCPLDVEQLGRATWSFLHTTAAYYPERPTVDQRNNMLALLQSLPALYPCTHCASHLGQNMKEHPPDVSGRIPLSRWLCERHNDVNERLGKETFDCATTDERWRDGPPNGSCD